MQYLLIMIIGILFYIEIDKLRKQIKTQQKQINELCKMTGNNQLAAYYISNEDKELMLHQNYHKKLQKEPLNTLQLKHPN